MTTPASSSAPRAPADENEELYNALLLQHETAKARLSEFHQQVELFVQQTGEHPLTGASGLRAAHESLPLRERTLPAHVAPLPLVSDVVAALVRALCAPSGAVRDAPAMTQLTKQLDGDASLTVEDQAQLLFVLDASFRLAPTTASILLSAFENAAGYGVLMGWFEAACVVADESHKALTKLLLEFLARHRPGLPYSRKATLARLKAMQSSAAGRKTKALLKEVIEKYKVQA